MLVEIGRSSECRHGVAVARRIIAASEQQWAAIVHELAANRQLSRAVRQINRMLEDPRHQDLAKSALNRIGLIHGA